MQAYLEQEVAGAVSGPERDVALDMRAVHIPSSSARPRLIAAPPTSELREWRKVLSFQCDHAAATAGGRVTRCGRNHGRMSREIVKEERHRSAPVARRGFCTNVHVGNTHSHLRSSASAVEATQARRKATQPRRCDERGGHCGRAGYRARRQRPRAQPCACMLRQVEAARQRVRGRQVGGSELEQRAACDF